MTERFSPEVMRILTKAGWFEGRSVMRDVVLPHDFEIFPAAEKVLAEFGNLKCGESGRGADLAASDVAFEPYCAVCESDRFAEHEAQLGVRFYPLGEAQVGHCFLAIDDHGRLYLIMDSIKLVGETFEEGLENVLLGKLPKRSSREGRGALRDEL